MCLSCEDIARQSCAMVCLGLWLRFIRGVGQIRNDYVCMLIASAVTDLAYCLQILSLLYRCAKLKLSTSGGFAPDL